MARTYARVFTSIWADDGFRALSLEAQGLYFRLLTDPELSMCGIADWRPARLVKSFGGMTKTRLEKVAEELEKARFVVIDRETEEALVRSFVRHDGVLKSPNLTKAMAAAWTAAASTAIRDSVVREVLRYFEDEPEAKGSAGVPDWFPKSYPNPSETVPEGFQNGSESVPETLPRTLPDELTEPFPNGSAEVPLEFPDPATSNLQPTTPKRESAKRAHALPEGWEPRTDVVATIRNELPNVDLRAEHAKFVDHFHANGKPMKDWDAAWRNWMRRAPTFTRPAVRQQHTQDVIAGALAHAASGAPNPYMAGEDR